MTAMELCRPMSRQENCWDNAPRKSGHRKDKLAGEIQYWIFLQRERSPMTAGWNATTATVTSGTRLSCAG